MSYKDRWRIVGNSAFGAPLIGEIPFRHLLKSPVWMGSSEGKCAGQLKLTAQTHGGSNWGLQARIPTRFQCLLQPSSLSSYMFPVQNTHQASILSADVSLVKASHSSVKNVGDLREKASTNQKEKPHSLRSHCGKNQHGSHAKGTGQSLKGHVWSCFFLNINNYRNRWEYSSVVAHLFTMCEALGSIPAPPKIK